MPLRNNRDMTLEQFKQIYWMEHAHRVYGRVLGLCILLPTALFTYKKWASPKHLKLMWAICGLVGFQVCNLVELI